MNWTKRQPVKAGDIVALTVLGIHGQYRVIRDAPDVLDLRLCDLVKVDTTP